MFLFVHWHMRPDLCVETQSHLQVNWTTGTSILDTPDRQMWRKYGYCVGTERKCMHAKWVGERERERHRTVHMCLNCLLLRQANIPLGGSGYPNTTNRSALFSFSSPNFSTWSSFHVSQARREEGEAFADAYTRAFSPPMSHTSPGTFSCCEPLIDSFISPAICNSLSLPPLEGHIAAFPAFIKWRMRRCGHRRCPPAGKHTYL